MLAKSAPNAYRPPGRGSTGLPRENGKTALSGAAASLRLTRRGNMGSAQIIVVDLAEDPGLAGLLPAGPGLAVHAVDDFAEALELASVVGAPALVVASAAAAGDPLARCAEVEAAVGAVSPLAVLRGGSAAPARVWAKPPASQEWVVVGPAGELVAPYLAALVEKGTAVVHVDLPGNAALRQRLADVGCNALVKAAAGETSVQTELHVLGSRAILKSTAFRAGRIALARRFALGFAANPLDEARRLAEEIHRETCDLVVREKP